MCLSWGVYNTRVPAQVRRKPRQAGSTGAALTGAYELADAGAGKEI